MSPESSGNVFETARRNGQAVLLDLLKATADATATFLESARLQPDAKRERAAILEKAEAALESIRYFTPRLDDPIAQNDIRAVTAALQAEFAALSPRSRTTGRLIHFPAGSPGTAADAKKRGPGKVWRIDSAAS